MLIDLATLRQIYSNAPLWRLELALPYLNDTMAKYKINTRYRIAAYLGQLAVESAEFLYARELHDGSNYEGRADLGNIYPGDGKRFPGRGDIQTTGRYNYQGYSDYTGVDFVNNPELLEEYPYRQDVAGWFWSTRKLNDLADLGNTTYTNHKGRSYTSYEWLTRKINGGLTHYDRRLAYYEKALEVLPFWTVGPIAQGEKKKADTGGSGRIANPHSFNIYAIGNWFNIKEIRKWIETAKS